MNWLQHAVQYYYTPIYTPEICCYHFFDDNNIYITDDFGNAVIVGWDNGWYEYVHHGEH